MKYDGKGKRIPCMSLEDDSDTDAIASICLRKKMPRVTSEKDQNKYCDKCSSYEPEEETTMQANYIKSISSALRAAAETMLMGQPVNEFMIPIKMWVKLGPAEQKVIKDWFKTKEGKSFLESPSDWSWPTTDQSPNGPQKFFSKFPEIHKFFEKYDDQQNSKDPKTSSEYPKIDYADNFPDLKLKNSSDFVIRLSPTDYAVLPQSLGDFIDLQDLWKAVHRAKLSTNTHSFDIPIELTWKKKSE